MPLKFLAPRPAKQPPKISRFRSTVNPLTRAKNLYQTAKQTAEQNTQSKIKQLSQDRTRLNRAIPNTDDPIKTSLRRRGDLVGNHIGWLQSLLPKK